MTEPHPLFEFMPYGAPELLDARRTQLLRALALANALAAAVFLIARAGGWSVARPVVVELPPLVASARVLEPPPSIREPAASRTPVASPPAAGPATPVPVADPDVPATQAPPVAPPSTGTGTGATPGPAVEPNGGAGGAALAPEDPLPGLHEFVYTDELPAVAARVDPVYPELALEAGIGGRVYVFMLVGRDGHVVRAEIDPRQSVPLLDDAALAAARRWVFSPALANGHPVAVWVGQAFVFTPRR